MVFQGSLPQVSSLIYVSFYSLKKRDQNEGSSFLELILKYSIYFEMHTILKALYIYVCVCACVCVVGQQSFI